MDMKINTSIDSLCYGLPGKHCYNQSCHHLSTIYSSSSIHHHYQMSFISTSSTCTLSASTTSRTICTCCVFSGSCSRTCSKYYRWWLWWWWCRWWWCVWWDGWVRKHTTSVIFQRDPATIDDAGHHHDRSEHSPTFLDWEELGFTEGI
jgi:hypothetical protein